MRIASARYYLGFLASCLLLFAGAGYAESERQPVAWLYRQFLAGNVSQGFVAFERTLVFPTRPALLDQGTNRVGVNRPNAKAKQFYAFYWNGSAFVIGYSSDSAITNEDAMASAEKLYGFDGTNFWRLLNEGVQTYATDVDEPGLFSPLETKAVLTVISKDEAVPQTEYKSNPTVATILELAASSRRIVQFGFSDPLAGAPNIIGANLIGVKSVDGREQLAQIFGDIQFPKTIEYAASSNVTARFRVALSSESDAIVVDRLAASGRVASSVSNRILVVSVPGDAATKSPFSWQTYHSASKGDLIVQAVKGGALFSAELLADGGIRTAEVISPAKALAKRPKYPLFVYLLFLCTSFGLIFGFYFFYQSGKSQIPKNKCK